MAFYAYKRYSDRLDSGMIYRELLLASFGSKAERDAYVTTHPRCEIVKASKIPARHLRTFRQYAAPLPGGLFCGIVDSGVNTEST